MISMIFMKGITSIFYILPFFIASCSCNALSDNIVFFQNDSIPVQQKLQKILQTPYLESLGLDELQINWMPEFY